MTTLCRPVQMSLPRKAVLMCLADRADDSGMAWPSVAGIAEWTCAGRTTVIEAVAWLEQNGFVSIVKSRGRNNKFVLNLEKLGAMNPKAGQCASRTSTPAVLVREADPTSAPAGLPPVRQPDYTSTPAVPEASISIRQASEKHQAPRANKPRKLSLVEEFPEYLHGIDPQLLTDWVAQRKGKRASISTTVLAGLSNQAKAAGISLSDVLRIMVEQNWQGFNADWLGGRKSVGRSKHHGFNHGDYATGADDGRIPD